MRRTLAVMLGCGSLLAAAMSLDQPPTFTPRSDPVDSARAEMEIGRHWHAALILEGVQAAGEAGPAELLLLGRARAGYQDWPGVAAILEDAPFLDTLDEGVGWGLLARAREESGDWGGAAEAYGHLLAAPAGRGDERPVHLVRRARALARDGEEMFAASVLEVLQGRRPDLASWAAYELLRDLETPSDTAVVHRLLRLVSEEDPQQRLRGFWARTLLLAGDTAEALRSFRAALDSVDGGRAAEIWNSIGDLELASADTLAATSSFQRAWELASGPGSASRLLALDALGATQALGAARALERAGNRDASAIEAYDLYLSTASDDPPEAVLFARVRLMARVPALHDSAIAQFRRLNDEVEDRELGARLLESWTALRRRQGRGAEVATLGRWLVDRYPESSQASEIVFFRGDAAQDRGDMEGALAEYRLLQEMNPELDRAGLARMRMAQIFLQSGDEEAALAVFKGYLEDFPDGRRWEEASFWASRILVETGRVQEGRDLVDGLAERSPVSYYTVQGAAALGERFRPTGLDRVDSLDVPDELETRLAPFDDFRRAGLSVAEVSALAEVNRWARDRSDAAMLGMARALIERGLTIEGIRLGWELRDRGLPWSRALLEVIYPFPHRDMVVRAARDRELDPILVAALIRQESAFNATIVSSAGAVGLMQVMPATGRQLADSEGPRDFSPASLRSPEINVHLGTRFLDDMLERYGGELPLVLSAYNAGPTRANRWRNFPEADDPLRFTERIPFGETRDYVKQVTRNRAIYGALYGDSLEGK